MVFAHIGIVLNHSVLGSHRIAEIQVVHMETSAPIDVLYRFTVPSNIFFPRNVW